MKVKIGDFIRIILMEGEDDLLEKQKYLRTEILDEGYDPLEFNDNNNEVKKEDNYSGREGIVTSIDDLGQIHGTWGGCALIPGLDQFELCNTQNA